MFLDAWRGFGEKMSDTLAGAPERWADGRYAEAVKSSSSGPFWIWAHQREEGHGFRARAAGPRLAAPRVRAGAGEGAQSAWRCAGPRGRSAATWRPGEEIHHCGINTALGSYPGSKVCLVCFVCSFWSAVSTRVIYVGLLVGR